MANQTVKCRKRKPLYLSVPKAVVLQNEVLVASILAAGSYSHTYEGYQGVVPLVIFTCIGVTIPPLLHKHLVFLQTLQTPVSYSMLVRNWHFVSA